MKTMNRVLVGVFAAGFAVGAGAISATPAAAAGKTVVRTIKILNWNSLANCVLGANGSQLTLTKQGKTITYKACTRASNGTYTSVVSYHD